MGTQIGPSQKPEKTQVNTITMVLIQLWAEYANSALTNKRSTFEKILIKLQLQADKHADEDINISLGYRYVAEEFTALIEKVGNKEIDISDLNYLTYMCVYLGALILNGLPAGDIQMLLRQKRAEYASL